LQRFQNIEQVRQKRTCVGLWNKNGFKQIVLMQFLSVDINPVVLNNSFCDATDFIGAKQTNILMI
jgi:hypothetical protein